MTYPGPHLSTTFAVIDTNIASAVVIGGRTAHHRDLLRRYDHHLRGCAIVLAFVTVAELRFGAYKGRWQERRIDEMEGWFRTVNVVMPDDDLVETYSRLRVDCCDQGHALQEKTHEADRWIAATALRYALPLVTDDGIVQAVRGLTLRTAPE